MSIKSAVMNRVEGLITSGKALNIPMFNQFMGMMIPFNLPHGFKIESLEENRCQVKIPFRKINHNHLSGIHACAMVTAGEYSCGMMLLKKFGLKKYRYILKSLSCDYHYQGRTDLRAVGELTDQQLRSLETGLENGATDVTIISKISDKNDNDVATVSTVWQVKSWKDVKTK